MEANLSITPSERVEEPVTAPSSSISDSVNMSSPQANDAVREMWNHSKQNTESLLNSWNDFKIDTGTNHGEVQAGCSPGTCQTGSGNSTSGLKATIASSAYGKIGKARKR
jgi:hypothetical protein